MFPLPVPHQERTSPLEFIPGCDDPTGAGDRMWSVLSMLKITQGKHAGKRLGEIAPPWQEKWVRSLYGAVDLAGNRFFQESLLLISKKNGKALHLDTQIPTPDGLKPLRDIHPGGGEVFGPDGRPTTVIAESEIMIGRPCYRVTFSTGESFIADAEHLWQTSTNNERERQARHQKHPPRRTANAVYTSPKTTEAVRETLIVPYNPTERNHAVAVAEPWDLPEKALPIDPYMLGIWLADGHSSSGSVTLCNTDAVPILIEAGERNVHIRKTAPSGATAFSLGTKGIHAPRAWKRQFSFTAKLSRLGVLGRKHIPDDYLFASRQQRQRLLQGILDGDGHASTGPGTSSTVEVTLKPDLACDVLKLIASLGFKPTQVEKYVQLDGRQLGPYLRTQFTAYQEDGAFSLPRKNDALKRRPARKTRSSTRKIVAVEPVPSVPVKCISVAAAHQQYLVGETGIPTHNSSISGLLAIAHTLCFPEERGSGIILAATKEQAGLVYDGMASTVEADPYLQKQFQVRRYRSDVVHKSTSTVLKSVSCELSSTVGTAPSFFVVDELHLLGANQRGAAMVRQLSSGMSVREHPMGIYITTAPLGPASGVYAATVARARRIMAGEAQDDRLLPVLFELFEDANLDNPDLWWMANPSLGITITREWLEQEHRIAKADPDPFAIANFYSQHLNVHAQERLGVDRWLPLDEWDKHADPTLTLARVVRDSDYLFCSVDAGGRDDPSVLLVMGSTPGGSYLVWSHQWLHRDGYIKRREHVPYAEFESSGELTVFDEPDADITAITNQIIKLSPANTAVDPYGLKTLVEILEGRGHTVTGIPQGWKLSPHIDYTERLIYAGRIIHHGGPMLRWNIGNARAEDRHGARSITKPSGASVGPEKIDGCLCLIMAGALATDHQPSTYDSHGIRML